MFTPRRSYGKPATLRIQAAKEGHADVCTVLLENNANTNKKGAVDAMPLFIAAKECHVDVCMCYLKTIQT